MVPSLKKLGQLPPSSIGLVLGFDVPQAMCLTGHVVMVVLRVVEIGPTIAMVPGVELFMGGRFSLLVVCH